MVRKVIFLLSVVFGLVNTASAQWCITSEKLQEYKDQYPQVAQYQAELEAYIKSEMQKMDLDQYKSTADPNDTLHIPVVVHVVHDYGNVNYVSDNDIYEMMNDINEVYMKRNADTANVIAPFKPYIGNPKMMFHLATKDPLGRPTTGITHRQTPLTDGGDDQAKFDQWAPDSYLNIWIIERIGRGISNGVVAAYATFPASAAASPYTDGIIASASQIQTNKTIPHEIGHIFNLIHPWGLGQVAQLGNCIGDDEVDDTPPTHGHFSGPANSPTNGFCNALSLYDTTCTNRESDIEKQLLDSNFSITTGTDTTAGIDFKTVTRATIRTVDIYPATIGDPFTIELRQYNGTSFTSLQTYNGTTTTDSGAQTVTLNFDIVPDSGYRLIVTENPGLNHDSVAAVSYVRTLSNVMVISNDIKNDRYNYLYKWHVNYGYFVGNIDYPDTVNTQNIMDYANCPIMFTDLQVERMRTAITSPVGRRNNLIKDSTHVKTGILDGFGGTYGQRLDLKPVPDFSIEKGFGPGAERTYFLCADNSSDFIFRNRSWRDTISSVTWEFGNGANIATSTNATGNVTNQFSTPGWVSVKLTATSNAGDSTLETFPVYAADPNNLINPATSGYYQEFNEGGDRDQWPIFNYYNNANKWELNASAGFYDNNSIVYRGYDNRTFPNSRIGTPRGDHDDFYTRGFDLSGMTSGDCNLNFMSSGALRNMVYAGTPKTLITDTLEIWYSANCGTSWTKMETLTGNDIANKGHVNIPYEPLWMGDWKLQSINIPVGARQSRVYFRFRFKPGVDNTVLQQGVGNNFYVDRINISNFPLGVNTLVGNENNIAIAPNPTTGNAYVVIKDVKEQTAQIQVTDVTGKVVYRTQSALNGSLTRVEIPASAITVKGIYMVQVVTGDNTHTEKLVVR